jgi:uncharacterized membrane protein YphA (DoxX/SURF4 family)
MAENIQTAARLLLGIFFLVSGISKIFSPSPAAEFLSTLLGLQLQSSLVVIILTSLFEIGLGALLILSPLHALLSASIACFVLLIFTLLGVFSFGEAASCGCLGDLYESEVDEYFFLRNFLLLLLAFVVLRSSPGASHAGARKIP